jgi:putative colanic acid biosynthesis UDP-glucose lipid carrier transferase
LALALPVLLLAAMAIRLTSRGPVIFRQTRVGLGGQCFTIYKLRSMYGAEEGGQVTAVGRIIRTLRIDELPQLINVLKGDMALVGPRPRPLSQDHQFAIKLIGYNLRREVRPGITGLAQVRRLNATDEEGRQLLDDDREYIHRMSLWLDLWILGVLTPWAILRSLCQTDRPPLEDEIVEVVESAEGQPAPEAST